MKYLEMIVKGRIPTWGAHRANTSMNRDIERFLYFFVKKGTEMTRPNLTQACRSLHLAFKTSMSSGRMDVEEIHGILTALLLKAARQYDPHYNNEIKRIIEVIDEHFKSVSFSAGEIRRYLDFDCDRHCSMLCRRGFLVEAQQRGRFECGADAWPPPTTYLSASPVGFTYYLSTWFRYALACLR